MDNSIDKKEEISKSLIGEIIDNKLNIIIDDYIEEHRNIENIINERNTNNDDKLNKFNEIAKNINIQNTIQITKVIIITMINIFIYYQLNYLLIIDYIQIALNMKMIILGNSLSNYELDGNYYLCYKHTKNPSKESLNERRGNNRHKKNRRRI